LPKTKCGLDSRIYGKQTLNVNKFILDNTCPTPPAPTGGEKKTDFSAVKFYRLFKLISTTSNKMPSVTVIFTRLF
jgi:hypothetical protein